MSARWPVLFGCFVTRIALTSSYFLLTDGWIMDFTVAYLLSASLMSMFMFALNDVKYEVIGKVYDAGMFHRRSIVNSGSVDKFYQWKVQS